MVLSKGHNDIMNDKVKEREMVISLGTVKINPRKKLNLLADFSEMMVKFKEEKKRREKEWLDDYYQAFGFGDENWGYDDGWDDEYYDGCVYVPRRYNGITMKSQRFMNGIEVDDNWDPIDGTQRKKGHGKRSSKNSRKRYMGGTIDDHYFQDDDDDDDVVFQGGGSEIDLESLKNAHKKIIFYRRLNNTADTYDWDNVYEFSEWLEEEGITISQLDAEDVVYQDEIHCCLDPETTGKKLVCALSYDDLVYVVTGGDADYLAEASQMTPFV